MILHLSIGAFSSESVHPLGGTHDATVWQVAGVVDPYFVVPLYDSGWSTVDLLEHDTTDIFDETLLYYARAAVRDDLEIESGWSEPVLVDVLGVRRTLERAWAFALDGHIFYVMNYVSQPALIYDTVAQQWYRWFTKDAVVGVGSLPYWNMFRGVVWNERTLAADFGQPIIWEVDPHSMLDEATKPIQRAVTGFLPLRGSASIRQGSLRVTARKKDAAQLGTLSMRFSDDNGKTWSAPRTVQLAANSYSQRLEFRSLGRVRAPGRLWEISDEGGFVNIYGTDADLEGAE